MRYNILTPDGLEVGFITDTPHFQYSVEESAPRYHDVVEFIRDSRDVEMVVTSSDEEPEEFALTPPEENVPATDKFRVIHLASQLPNNLPLQVEPAEDMDKWDIAGEVAGTIFKERRYIDDPSEAPEGADVQEGPQGGLYYETSGESEGEPSEPDVETNYDVNLTDLNEGDFVVLQDHETFDQVHGKVTDVGISGITISLENGETETFDQFDPLDPLGEWDELGRKERVGEEEEDEFAGKPYDSEEERAEYMEQLRENRLEEVGYYNLSAPDEGEPQGTPISEDQVMNTEPNDFGVRASEEDINTLESVIESGSLGQELGVTTRITDIDEDNPFGESDMGRPEREDPAVDVAIDTEDYLNLQFALQHEHFGHHHDNEREHRRSFFGDVRVDDIKEYAETLREEPGEMDYPALFLRNDGSVDSYQEGRHRALGALRAGVDEIPVRVILDADRDAKSAPNVDKARRYIQDPAEAPEGIEVQHGPQGGLYYETEGEEGTEETSDEQWIPYISEQGERGWLNTETGEVEGNAKNPPVDLEGEEIGPDNQLQVNDFVRLEYDDEVHYGYVYTDRGNGEMVVIDDRHRWDVPKDGWDEDDDFYGMMEVERLGQPDDKTIPPEEIEIDSVEDAKYVLDNIPQEGPKRLVNALQSGTISIDEAREAAEQSWGMLSIGSDMFERGATRETSDGKISLKSGRGGGGEEDKLRTAFEEQAGEEASQMVARAARGWEQSMYGDRKSAPLVQYAMNQTGNDTTPEYRHSDIASETTVSEQEIRAMESISNFTTEKLREAFGDEITVFRGFAKNPHRGTPSEGTDVVDRMKAAKEGGESVTIEHRPVESWSLNPDVASLYGAGGAIIKQTIPVERIAMSSSVGYPDESEEDTLVMHEGEGEYSPEQIILSEETSDDEMHFNLRAEAVKGAG